MPCWSSICAGLTKQPVAQLAASAQPWLILGVTMMIVSGVPLFLAESIKCLYSFAFWVKMSCLLLVLLFTFTVYRHVTRTKSASDRTSVARSAAVISLVLWAGVAWRGRWIGFS